MSGESDDSSDSSDAYTPPLKRRRIIQNYNGPDRLSTLPDSVILHILSFLSIRDSVQTGLLSRRWEYLWTCVPSLSFHYDDYDDSDEPVTSDLVRFAEFIVKTLVLSHGFVKNLAVSFPYRKQFAYYASVWARFASKNGVEKLELDFTPPLCFARCTYGNDPEKQEDDMYTLPQFLFSDSKFRELRFSWCKIEPKKTVTWNFLKKLSIGYVILSDNTIPLILAGTPLLEMLELYNFKGIRNLHIGDSGVRRLVLRDPCKFDFGFEALFPMEISAPSVQSLEMSGFFGGCQLVDLKSLVEATLFGFYLGDAEVDKRELMDMAPRFLDSIAHVKTLTLGRWAITMLAVLHKNHWSPRLSKCECLTIDTEVWESHQLGIAFLLRYYPLLQTLIFSKSPTPDFDESWVWGGNDDEAFSGFEKEFYLSPIPFSGFTHLKIVKFSWSWNKGNLNFELVEILLKNAGMLQKMIIHMTTNWYFPDRRQLLKAAQKLLSFQRCYPHAELLVDWQDKKTAENEY